jgi:hypothetical protein
VSRYIQAGPGNGFSRVRGMHRLMCFWRMQFRALGAQLKLLKTLSQNLVELVGLEPTTSSLRTMRSTKLSYSPMDGMDCDAGFAILPAFSHPHQAPG